MSIVQKEVTPTHLLENILVKRKRILLVPWASYFAPKADCMKVNWFRVSDSLKCFVLFHKSWAYELVRKVEEEAFFIEPEDITCKMIQLFPPKIDKFHYRLNHHIINSYAFWFNSIFLRSCLLLDKNCPGNFYLSRHRSLKSCLRDICPETYAHGVSWKPVSKSLFLGTLAEFFTVLFPQDSERLPLFLWKTEICHVAHEAHNSVFR